MLCKILGKGKKSLHTVDVISMQRVLGSSKGRAEVSLPLLLLLRTLLKLLLGFGYDLHCVRTFDVMPVQGGPS